MSNHALTVLSAPVTLRLLLFNVVPIICICNFKSRDLVNKEYDTKQYNSFHGEHYNSPETLLQDFMDFIFCIPNPHEAFKVLLYYESVYIAHDK